jgi:hypothetical protein
MDARLLRAALIVSIFCCLGASYRTRNFMVTAATPDLAQEVCEEAERFRRELALDWLGQELAPWPAPCPIQVKVGPRLGAGGATSFAFNGRYPMHWQMEVFGSRERVLDSVLPHEVMHTVFATHFGQPLPRWADEGACTTVEHHSERDKHKKLLVRFLKTGKGIPFNRMFAMKQYPPEMLPLYAQGYSVARYLIEQGGRPKFVEFVGEGLQTNNWDAAIRNHYGFKDLSELQLTWVDWVADGSPPLQEGQVLEQLADGSANGSFALQSPDGLESPNSLESSDTASRGPVQGLEEVPAAAVESTAAGVRARPSDRSWYAAQRDLARRREMDEGRRQMAEGRRGEPASRGLKPSVAPADQQELLEWREGQPLPRSLPPSAQGDTVWR